MYQVNFQLFCGSESISGPPSAFCAYTCISTQCRPTATDLQSKTFGVKYPMFTLRIFWEWVGGLLWITSSLALWTESPLAGGVLWEGLRVECRQEGTHFTCLANVDITPTSRRPCSKACFWFEPNTSVDAACVRPTHSDPVTVSFGGRNQILRPWLQPSLSWVASQLPEHKLLLFSSWS